MRQTVFEDVSDAINRVVGAVRRRKDDAAMDEIEGMCCADPKQFWCRYMPGVSQHLRLAAPSSRPASCSAAASAAVGAGAAVAGGVGRGVGAVSSAASSSSADNSILERKESGAGRRLRFSCAAERERKGASVHCSVKAKPSRSAASKPLPSVERDRKAERSAAERRTLQQRLTVVMDGLLLDELLDASDAANGARLLHCAMPHAWLWLLVCPLERCLVLSDQDMCAALRHQYGLPPKAGAPWYCRCGGSVAHGHLHTCNRVAGPATYARHEMIVSELCAAAQTHMQLHVVRQPVMPFAERVERGEAVAAGRARVVPDVLFDGADLCLATDVSVLFGAADSKLDVQDPVPKAGKRLRKQCAARETQKQRKYEERCRSLGAKFTPFVVESHGFVSRSAVDVLDRLARYGGQVLGCNAYELSGYLKRRVAIAIQRGNAALDRAGLQLSRNSYGAAVASGMVVAASKDSAQRSRTRSRSHSAKHSARSRSHSAQHSAQPARS